MGMEGVGRDGEEEGPMMRSEQLQTRILEELDMTREIEDEELTRLIYRVLQEASEEEYLPLAEKTALGRELFNAFRKLDLLQEFLEDESITEIMINGTQNIFYEQGCSVLDAVCWMQCAGSVQSTFSPCSGLSRCFWLLSLSSTIKPSHTMEWACWQFIQISHDDGL